MFGYIIINKGEMKFKEFDVYHSYYCGLCQALKEQYSWPGQASLTYDMTFVTMLLSSLYEPDTTARNVKCIAHPFEKHCVRENEFSSYAADMNVLFSYYKCLDDWEDERKVSGLAYGKLLKKAYATVRGRYPEKVAKIDRLMSRLSQEEKSRNQDVDQMAGLFGKIMGEILAVRADEWQNELFEMGSYLGKFIYLSDAYEDMEEDLKKGNYNPLASRLENPDFEEEVKTILTMMMAGCCKAFEKLPIIENAEILRNILYSGVWYRYELSSQKRRAVPEEDRTKEEGQGAENA